MDANKISSGFTCLDNLTKGFEIGGLTFVLGILPWIDIEIWLAVQFAMKMILDNKGSASILCFHTDPNDLKNGILRLYPEAEDKIVIENSSKIIPKGNYHLIIYDCKGKRYSQVVEAVRKASTANPLMMVLECVKTENIDSKEYDKDIFLEVEIIAQMSSSTIIIVPYGASIGLLPPTDSNEHKRYMEDAKNQQGEFGYLYKLEDRWLKLQMLVDDNNPEYINEKLLKGIVRLDVYGSIVGERVNFVFMKCIRGNTNQADSNKVNAGYRFGCVRPDEISK